MKPDEKSQVDDANRQIMIWQLVTMLVVAITPWDILFSRTAFEGHLAQMLLALAVLLLLYFWQHIVKNHERKTTYQSSKKCTCNDIVTTMSLQQKNSANSHSSGRYLIVLFLLLTAAGAAGGLAFWTYFSVRFVWPVVFILLTCYFLLTTRRWRVALTSTLVVGLIFALMFVAMTRDPFYQRSNDFRLSTASILNNTDLPHEVNYYRQQTGNNLLSRVLYNQKTFQAGQLLQNVAAHLDFDYLFLTGDENLRHSTGFTGLFYLLMAPLLIWGMIRLWQRQPLMFGVIIGWWLIGLLPASVPLTGVPHALRTLNSLVPMTLLIGLGLAELITTINNSQTKISRSRGKKLALITIIIGLLLLELGRFGWYYLTVYPTLSAYDWQAASNYHLAIIEREKHNYHRIYAFDLEMVFYLWYLVYADTDITKLQAATPIDEFKLAVIDNVDFAKLPIPPHLDNDLILAPKAILLPHLENSQIPYEVIYDYELYGVEYLGVAVIP